MEPITGKEIADIFAVPIPDDIMILGVTTDTRKIEKGFLFIAIKGEKFDGNEYIQEGIEKGAVLTIGMNKEKGKVPHIQRDGVEALGKIAAYYRKRAKTTMIGITGSVGKTSTREMIWGILRKKGKTLQTEKNLNNEIGTAHTLLKLDKTYDFGVIEMGMCDFGEIEYLSKIVRPKIGVITNIGHSHIQQLKSQEGILTAKLEILKGMDKEGVLVVSGDDDLLYSSISKISQQVLTYGIENKHCDVVAKNMTIEEGKTKFTISYKDKEYRATLPVLGEHNVQNALAGFLVGKLLGVEEERILEGIEEFSNTGMRQKIVEYKGLRVIEDCYNASEESMISGLSVLSLLSHEGKKIAVLGDILELGEYAEKIHKKVGEEVGKRKIDLLITLGKQGEIIGKRAKEDKVKVVSCYTHDEVMEVLKSQVSSGDAILVKGSRGMKLEEVVERIYKEL